MDTSARMRSLRSRPRSLTPRQYRVGWLRSARATWDAQTQRTEGCARWDHDRRLRRALPNLELDPRRQSQPSRSERATHVCGDRDLPIGVVPRPWSERSRAPWRRTRSGTQQRFAAGMNGVKRWEVSGRSTPPLLDRGSTSRAGPCLHSQLWRLSTWQPPPLARLRAHLDVPGGRSGEGISGRPRSVPMTHLIR